MRVIVHDSKNIYHDGAVVTPGDFEVMARQRPMVSLPIDPARLRDTGAGAYVKRAWGSGWPVQQNIPSILASIVLHVPPEASRVEWVAHVVRTSDAQPRGRLRLSLDTTSPVAGFPVTQIQDSRPLEECEPYEGGLLVRGVSRVNVPHPSLQPLALYGMGGGGLAVAWLAASTMPF